MMREFLRNSEPCSVSIRSRPLKKPADCSTGMKFTHTSPLRIWPVESAASSLYSWMLPALPSEDCAIAAALESRQQTTATPLIDPEIFIAGERLAKPGTHTPFAPCHDIHVLARSQQRCSMQVRTTAPSRGVQAYTYREGR